MRCTGEAAAVSGDRVSLTSTQAQAFGDVVTPGPIEIDYPILLDFPSTHIRVYPVEAVSAEKFNAMVTLGIANSRLKDFHDLWLISRTFAVDQADLVDAVKRTFEQLQTLMPDDVPIRLTEQYADRAIAVWISGACRHRTRGLITWPRS